MLLEDLKAEEKRIKLELSRVRERFLFYKHNYFKLNSMIQENVMKLHDLQKEILEQEGKIKKLPSKAKEAKTKRKPKKLSDSEMLAAFEKMPKEKLQKMLEQLRA